MSVTAIGTYMEAHELPTLGKTRRFQVTSTNHGSHLGTVKWYGRWRCYVFWPADECIFNGSCLQAMATFIDGLMQERRTARE